MVQNSMSENKIILFFPMKILIFPRMVTFPLRIMIKKWCLREENRNEIE